MSTEPMQVRDASPGYMVGAWELDVPPGYKRTEVGVIPEDWMILTGEQITTLIGKGGSPRWQGFEYASSGMLFVTSENVRDGCLDISEPKYLPLAFHEKLKRTKLQKRDILINLVGASIGRSCRIKQDLGDANVNQAVAVFRVSIQHSSAFVAFCFQAQTTIKRILDMQVDAARPNISLGDLRRFPIPMPATLPEQRAIAEALSDVDGLIGALDTLIAKKRANKQAAMQQLLTGKTRLPGFRGAWGTRKLMGITGNQKERFDDGDWIESEYIASSGIRLIQTGNIGTGTFLNKESRRYITEETFKALHCKEVKAGDLLICRLAEPAGRACIVPEISEEKMITSVDVTVCRPLEETADSEYLVQLFSTQWWLDQVELKCGGSTRTRIARGQLGQIELKLPPIEEQTAIATVLSDMDAEITALEQRRDKTRALKQGMMQQLLTGRVRLV